MNFFILNSGLKQHTWYSQLLLKVEDELYKQGNLPLLFIRRWGGTGLIVSDETVPITYQPAEAQVLLRVKLRMRSDPKKRNWQSGRSYFNWQS